MLALRKHVSNSAAQPFSETVRSKACSRHREHGTQHTKNEETALRTESQDTSSLTSAQAADNAYEREAREWLANVYQGDSVRQLSLRSIVQSGSHTSVGSQW